MGAADQAVFTTLIYYQPHNVVLAHMLASSWLFTKLEAISIHLESCFWPGQRLLRNICGSLAANSLCVEVVDFKVDYSKCVSENDNAMNFKSELG